MNKELFTELYSHIELLYITTIIIKNKYKNSDISKYLFSIVEQYNYLYKSTFVENNFVEINRLYINMIKNTYLLMEYEYKQRYLNTEEYLERLLYNLYSIIKIIDNISEQIEKK